MSTDQPSDTAAEHLAAALVDRPSSPAGRSFRMIASLAVGMLSADTEALSARVDLVVTRRTSGAVVLRVPAGSLQEADLLLSRVRQDLASKTVAQFVAEWRTPDEDDPVTSSRG